MVQSLLNGKISCVQIWSFKRVFFLFEIYAGKPKVIFEGLNTGELGTSPYHVNKIKNKTVH